ncbi:hypothetical protein D3C81_2325610 [compost metagenome]
MAPKLNATHVSSDTGNATPTPDTPGVIVSTISECPAARVCFTAFIKAVLDTPICA